MNSSWFFVALALGAGALGGIHVPINGALGARIGSALVATLTFYGVAFLVIAAVNALLLDREALTSLARVPAWTYLLPGLISVMVVGANTYLIPRLGAMNLFVLVVATQLVVRSVISHFGWLASPVDPIGWTQVAGAVLVFSGAILVVRN
jgi:transporter family-2 protein